MLFLVGIFLSMQAVAEDRAFIIGINAYEEAALEGCRTDAENMYQTIQEVWGYKSEQIKMLVDKEATRQAILDAFDNWLVKGTRSGDRVFFYYSGHGTQLPDDNSDEDDGWDEAYCPVDMKMIRDDEINQRLHKLSGRQVIFVSDSCHSGTNTRGLTRSHKIKRLPFKGKFKSNITLNPDRGVGVLEKGNNVVEPLNNVISYSAVSPSQEALDGGPEGGVFTKAFVKAVKEKAADRDQNGKITHAEVLAYVQDDSQAYCDKTGQCNSSTNQGHLTPQLDANAKWNSIDITTKVASPPDWSSSVDDVIEVAQGLENNNAARLKTNILPSSLFSLKDKMQFSISSQRTGYLLLLDINSEGKLTIIFPNEYSKKENRKGTLEAGQTITIPDSSYNFEFEAQEPVGQGLLLTLLIEENESIVQSIEGKLKQTTERGFGVIEKTSEVNRTLEKLYQKLHQTVIGPEGVGRPIKWSVVTAEYEINR